MTKLTALQEQQQDSEVRLAELKQQHDQLQAQLQQQVQPLLFNSRYSLCRPYNSTSARMIVIPTV